MDHRVIAAWSVGAIPLGILAQVTGMGSTHPEEFGAYGSAVGAIPDLNGDGKPDIAIGASNETVQGKPGAGRVYIYSGATGGLIRVLISPGFQASGGFGISVSGVPDLNGDGKGDIAVGAFNEGNSGPFKFDGPGKVYIFSGVDGKWLRTITSPNAEPGGGFGISVAGIGDLNNDGKGDLVVGAWTEDPGIAPADSGKAYLFHGGNGSLLRSFSSPAPQGGGGFGQAVAAIPDLTGDGKPDIAVTALGEAAGGLLGAGRVHIFNGATGAFVRTLISPNKETDGAFGRSIAGVPDATGDGRGDILVGAPYEDPGAAPADSGRAYFFNGATGALVKALAPGAPLQNGAFGYAVAGIPDLNGDARGDLAIGAIGMNPGGPAYRGRVFIYSGASGVYIKTLASPKQGPEAGFGTGLAALADVNGNNKGEVVAGSPSEDAPNGTNEAGRAYLFRN